MKVRFISSPIIIGLGYAVGSEADLTEAQAKELIETGFAEAVESEVREAITNEPKEIKKAIKKRNG